MKTDLSKELYRQYKKYEDNKVKIKLKNAEVLIGILMGHYFGDANYETYIKAWDFIDEKYIVEGEEINALSTNKDIRIEQADILEVYFYADNTTLIL